MTVHQTNGGAILIRDGSPYLSPGYGWQPLADCRTSFNSTESAELTILQLQAVPTDEPKAKTKRKP